ncbi:MAG: UDP-glucose 4-epimerase GalE [Candidatus Gracilibacteria bacterium]|nr:UDP-glucose 4-epimerase GalE [Candidatus Gracilibacteria bacterium]
MQTILLTGGTGYIGSHGAVKLLELGYDVVIIDNLSNSDKSILEKIQKITGKTPKFYEGDLRDKNILEKIFKENNIKTILHFAGAKAVGESCEIPFYYYENNLAGSINLFEIMNKYNCKNIIFSSSATVYDSIGNPPYIETDLTGNTTNPYGTTKFLIENILKDLATFKSFKVVNLRYFNPIGAHFSGLIGENPNGLPNNLLPYVMKVATGELKNVKVFGNDYNTKDGTGERDYIHILDLIDGHIASINFIENFDNNKGFFEVFNLGTGTATSVLEIIKITCEVTEKNIPFEIVPRRPGDLDKSFCNPEKAENILNWKAKYLVKDAIKDSWYFIKNNSK